MKKQYLMMLFVALVLCLTGCGECRHEWIEADCLNPKVCTKCDVTEGNALGHDFAAANCENPEICTRCGTTQGEALGHSWQAASCTVPETCAQCGSTQGEVLPHAFGKWEITESNMYRTCAECSHTETIDIDREAFFWDHIAGHWDPYIIFQGNSGYLATILGKDSVQFCVKILADGKITLINGDEVQEGTVSFTEYNESSDAYVMELDFEGEEEPLFAFIYNGDEGVELYLGGIVFSQFDRIRDYAQGLWASADGGIIRALTLEKDGSFDYNGEFSGEWHIRPMVTGEYQNRSSDILLSYSRDGAPVTDYLEISLGDEIQPLEDFFYFYANSAYGYLNMDYDYLSMTKTEPEELAAMEQAIAEGNEKLLGTWESQTAGKYIYDDIKTSRRIEKGYSITFHDDGTFVVNLDQEMTGTWKFEEVSQNGETLTYRYELAYDQSSDVPDLSAIYSEFTGLELYEHYEGYNMSYSFQRPENPVQEEGSAILCRDWTSYSANIFTQDTTEYETWEETGYTLTFLEDGTFTGMMDEAMNGKWVCTSKSLQTFAGGETMVYYSYLIQKDGEADYMNVLISNENELNLSTYDGTCTESWNFIPAE